MKLFIIPLLIFFLINNSLILAQKIDSIYIDQLIKRTNEIAKKDRGLAIDSLNYTYNKSAEINYYKGKSISLRKIGFHYINMNNAEQALKIFDELIALRKSQNDFSGWAEALIDKSYNLEILERYDDALEESEKSIKVAASSMDTARIIECYIYKNSVLLKKDKLFEGMQILLKALKLSEIIEDSSLIIKAKQFIGHIYNRQGDIKTAVKYYEEIKRYGETRNNKFKLVAVYNDLGIFYKNLGQYDKSLEVYQKGLKISIETNRQLAKILYYMNIAKLYNTTGKYQKSYENILQAETLANQAKFFSKKRQTGIYQQKASTLVNLGRPVEALPIALKAKTLSTGLTDWKKIANVNKTLADAYEALNLKGKAIEFYKEYTIAKDSLNSLGKTKDLANLEAKFEYENKEKENLLLIKEAELDQTKLEKQQNIIYVIILFSILVTISTIFYYRAFLKRKKLYNKIDKDKILIENQANKLKALDKVKTRFFANISHDLRSPLTLILGNAELALKDKDNILTENTSKHLNNVQLNGKRLLQLIEEINDLNLLEDEKLQLSFQSVNISPYLELIVSLFRSAAMVQRIDLEFYSTISNEDVYLLDTGNFEKIIFNLISNAIKYSKAKGKVLISIDKTGNSRDGNHQVRITVSDDGEGIEHEDQAYIFERYFQSHQKGFKAKEGIGIGLSLVKEIVNAFNGDISVKSKKGEGSVFTVLLPLIKDPEYKTGKLPELSTYFIERNDVFNNLNEEHYDPVETFVDLSKSDDKGQKVVLVVDDHKDVRSYISNIVKLKFSVLEAKNGEHALKILKKEIVNVIITDLMMPWLDGFGLLEILKTDEQLSLIPVMVVSARASFEDKMKVLDLGVNEFISKPFDANELLFRVSNIIERDSNHKSNKDLYINFPEKLDNVQNNILKKIEAIIIDRIADKNLGVLDLADALATSERQAYRLVKEISGFSPKEYIREIRFQYARDLINNKSAWTVGEVANAIGMNNTTNFVSQYQKRFNQNPRELLKQKKVN